MKSVQVGKLLKLGSINDSRKDLDSTESECCGSILNSPREGGMMEEGCGIRGKKAVKLETERRHQREKAKGNDP